MITLHLEDAEIEALFAELEQPYFVAEPHRRQRKLTATLISDEDYRPLPEKECENEVQ